MYINYINEINKHIVKNVETRVIFFDLQNYLAVHAFFSTNIHEALIVIRNRIKTTSFEVNHDFDIKIYSMV